MKFNFISSHSHRIVIKLSVLFLHINHDLATLWISNVYNVCGHWTDIYQKSFLSLAKYGKLLGVVSIVVAAINFYVFQAAEDTM